ncbi:MAG: hypothetical protein ACPGJS_10320 [Flammeovirgaceae bacterium]
MSAKPVIFIAFANEALHEPGRLRNLQLEQSEIRQVLFEAQKQGLCELVDRSAVTIDELIDVFQHYKDRIHVFHFGGHANSWQLLLNAPDKQGTHAAHSEGLAQFLAQQNNLKLIFLNGCSTQQQALDLIQHTESCIIGTTASVNDTVARKVAVRFFKGIAAQLSIEKAWEAAKQLIHIDYGTANVRDLMWEGIETPQGEASQENLWELYAQNPSSTAWKLPTPKQSDEHQIFNELLTKQLIIALQSYSKPAKRFLATASEVDANWQKQPQISAAAKKIIAYSFVGVLGIQLKKLMAIGNEAHSITKMKKYVYRCMLTAKQGVQLLCFTFISKLWDYQKEQKQPFTPEQHKSLHNFFHTNFELDLLNYLKLLRDLVQIFETQQLPFPMPSEKEAIKTCLSPNSRFIQSCQTLQELQSVLSTANLSIQTCIKAEQELSNAMEELTFLAAYKMVSIKDIAYDEMRNRPPRYLHQYTALGVDSKSVENAQRVNYVDHPISTDAILLFKEKYHESVNLFPFVIDYHALTDNGLTKVCFFSNRKLEDDSLDFHILEDGHIENIEFSNVEATAESINHLMMDDAKRIQWKLDSVYTQFEAAKHAIIDVPSTDSSTKTLDLGNLFEGEEDF